MTILCDSCKRDITNEITADEQREFGDTGWTCDDCAQEQERTAASKKYNAEIDMRNTEQFGQIDIEDFNNENAEL